MPQDFEGTFPWQVPGTHTRGTLIIHPDAETVVPDTLTTSEGDVIECEAISSCPLRCGPICFQVSSGRLHGLLDRCAEYQVPVRRRLRDPRTGQVQVVKEILTRTDCREEPVWVDDAPLPSDSA